MADGVANEDGASLETLKRQYQEALTLTKDARVSQQKDGDYYDGYQLTRDEKRLLKKRRQPDTIWNFTRLWVNGTLGVIKQGTTDPRAYPRNPQDEEAADVASKTLRYIADTANFDALKIDVCKDYLVPGTGAAIVEVDDDLKVTVTQIRWEEFFYDPRSRRQDFSDARYMGVAKWVWADDLKAEYPQMSEAIESAFASGSILFDDTMEDRPTDAGTVGWVDKRQQRLMKVEMYYRRGQAWHRCVFFTGGVLEEGESAYKDDKGYACNPIEAQSCYVDRENNRMGIVRDMRGPQDEINKRSSKLLFELTARQVQESQPGSGMGDIDVVRAEAARPDGVLPPGWQIVSRQDIVTGQERLLQNAIASGERFAPNPAMLGRQEAGQSGRAQLVRQQAGLTEMAIIFGGIEEWELRIYRQMWNRARQFWTAPMWIRVTDDEGSPQFVGVNQPPEGGQPMPDPSAQPDEQGRVPQLMVQGKPAFQMPDGMQVLGYENALAELDVDITIETVPDTATLQQEQFAVIGELAKMYGPQEFPADDLIELSSMPNKRAVMEKRKTRAEQAQQAGQQSPQAQLQLRGAMAEVAKTESEVALNEAKTQTEMAKPQMEAAKLYQQADAAEIDAQFRGAEMAQADNQFSAGTASKERLAQMQAEARQNTPPPGGTGASPFAGA
jgi:hypothetical protein